MSSHSGTIGRMKRSSGVIGSSNNAVTGNGSGSGSVSGNVSGSTNALGNINSEYYFSGGETIRRQRSAEWHSRHACNSSSEDEYQNTGQSSAFDTQLLAQLLLQSQQLANMDRYNSDLDNEELFSRLSDFSKTKTKTKAKPKHANSSTNMNDKVTYVNRLHQDAGEDSNESTELCSPVKHITQNPSNIFDTPTIINNNTAIIKEQQQQQQQQQHINYSHIKSTRNTNPFLNAKYEAQSNSDSLSERLSLSGSSSKLDRITSTIDYGTINKVPMLSNTFALSATTTTTTMTPNLINNPLENGNKINAYSTQYSENHDTTKRLRSHHHIKNSRLLNRSKGMSNSSSATSSNSLAINNPANTMGRSERDMIKLHELQTELREYSQTQSDNLSDTANSLDTLGELNCLRNDMQTPPEPAPPEIPPRAQSLLMSLCKHSEYKLKYEEKGDQKHEEFIPTSQQQQQRQQQQKDYLMPDGIRCSESQTKSVGSSDTQSQSQQGF